MLVFGCTSPIILRIYVYHLAQQQSAEPFTLLSSCMICTLNHLILVLLSYLCMLYLDACLPLSADGMETRQRNYICCSSVIFVFHFVTEKFVD